jgi:hypothetical protein
LPAAYSITPRLTGTVGSSGGPVRISLTPDNHGPLLPIGEFTVEIAMPEGAVDERVLHPDDNGDLWVDYQPPVQGVYEVEGYLRRDRRLYSDLRCTEHSATDTVGLLCEDDGDCGELAACYAGACRQRCDRSCRDANETCPADTVCGASI